ncbi:MAG: hypothetical protein LBE36_01170 [Flavobacteriaceae bacterium]|jgi:DNA-binding CsgD family transcriptional regulator|nr:hypothetical protein [Flavobacteriaceae bacterium]
MNRTILTCFAISAISISTKISAQRGELIAIDSLSKVINNPKISQREKIKPMTELSLIYADEGDSLKARKLLNQARILARKEKDSKYMIYVLNWELMNILDIYPRNITKTYKIIDSVYVAISKTTDLEAQASGYDCIGYMKSVTDLKYNFDDCFTAISLTEKLPESSQEKYVLLFNIYKTLFADNMSKGKTANTEKYLNEMYRAAEKTGNKNNICIALYAKLYFTVHLLKDEKTATQNFESLERYISQNRNRLSSLTYGNSVVELYSLYLTYPNAHYKEMLKPHVENCKKITGKNRKTQRMLFSINLFETYERKDYAKTIELCKKQIEIDKNANPNFVSNGYSDLSGVYTEIGQHQQATEAMAESLKYYKQSVNEQIEEQRQLAEVKFETEKKEAALKAKILLYLIISISLTGFLIFSIILFNRRNKRLKLEKEYAQQQTKLKEYEKETAQKRLVAANLQMLKKNETLEKITKKSADEEAQKLIREDFLNDKFYTDFEKIFEGIHPQFFEFLREKAAPNNLTNLDLRYCAYIYLQKGNKEISNELNVSYYTVVSNKKDLKRKLHLDKNSNFKDLFSLFTHPD